MVDKKKPHYSESMVTKKVQRKPHYSQKEQDDDLGDIALKHLKPVPKEEAGRRQRTVYLSDENYLPAKAILGSRLNEYLDDCCAFIVNKSERLGLKPSDEKGD